MKYRNSFFYFLTAFALLLVSLTGCNNSSDPGSFSYSSSIDDNGYWKGITARDYVELFEYEPFAIPNDIHNVSEDSVQSKINSLLEEYATTENVTNRAVQDGDTVNIDYVGSVDGVAFEGGTTNGAGTEVIIGETNYIDDFIEQLIGHTPGETFDVNATFPEDYGQENLNGKDAVFVTTINHIVETTYPELTDAFVSEHFSEEYGWTTVSEMKDSLTAELQEEAIKKYVQDYLYSEVAVSSVPDSLLQYQEDAMLKYYWDYAQGYGVSLEEFLANQVGVSLEELIENNAEKNAAFMKYILVIQAVAEDAGITATDEDVLNYYKAEMGTEDYSTDEEELGMPYLKQIALEYKVTNYLIEHAELK